jgi:hypothetical protein
MKKGGAKTWYFPDGYLPEKNENGKMEAHEALMLLNTGANAANVIIDIYFEKKPPVSGIKTIVPAGRVKALRMDNPSDVGGAYIPPLTQYALRVSSDENIVAQFGRLDTTQNNMAYYGSGGYHE